MNRTRRDEIILDAIRGACALYVVGFHCIEYLTALGSRFHSFGGPESIVLSDPALGWLAFGHYAVLVFFVLSGYVVHLRQARHPNQRYETGVWRWIGHYLWRRGARIYPPLIVAMIFTLIVDAVARAYSFPFYSEHVAADRLSSALIILFPIHFRRFGSDSPMWSIQYELLFYLAYICVLLVVVDQFHLSPIKIATAIAVAGLFSDVFFTTQHLYQPFLMRVGQYSAIWVAGMALADLRTKGTIVKRPLAMGIAGTAVIGIFSLVADNISRVWIDYGWAAGIVLIMAAMLLRDGTARQPRAGTRLLSQSAAWSYSLYLVHFPLIILMHSAWTSQHQLPASPVLAIPAFCVAVLAGIAAWWMVERPSRWLVAHPPRILVRRSAAIPVPSATD